MRLTIVYMLSNNIMDEYIIDINESIKNIIKRIDNKIDNKSFKLIYNNFDFIIYKYYKENFDFLLKHLNIEERENIILKILIINFDCNDNITNHNMTNQKQIVNFIKTNECLDILYYIHYKNHFKLYHYLNIIILGCLDGNLDIILKIHNKILVLFIIDIEYNFNFYCVFDSILEFVSNEIKDDKEIILAAINKYNNGTLIQFASENLRNDKELIEYAVSKTAFAFRYASEEIQKDRLLALKAVSGSGYLLKYLSDDYKRDREIVLAAVKFNGCALKYVHDDIKNDEEISLAAINQTKYAYNYLSTYYKNIFYNKYQDIL